MSSVVVPRPPSGFVAHAHDQSWTVLHPRGAVWAWLNDPATFIDGQIPPYRVEFVDDTGAPAGFDTGVFTAHHGPGILFAGRLGTLTPPAPGETAYRDLRYDYGSYAGSLRLARPTRLQFWVDAKPAPAQAGGDEQSTVRVRLDADVARWLRPAWALSMQVFWSSFGRSIDRQVALRADGAAATSWRLRPTLALAAGAAVGTAVLALRR